MDCLGMSYYTILLVKNQPYQAEGLRTLAQKLQAIFGGGVRR